jgi:hypothetical protein
MIRFAVSLSFDLRGVLRANAAALTLLPGFAYDPWPPLPILRRFEEDADVVVDVVACVCCVCEREERRERESESKQST